MKVQDNVMKNMGRLIFWYPIRWTARLMPFEIAGLIGRLTGRLDYFLFKGRSQRIKHNLLHSLGDQFSEQTAREIVKKILANHYTLILEFFKYPQINSDNINNIVGIEGIENLEDALSLGRGAVIGHFHFGSKLLLIVGLGLRNYPIHQIAYHMPKEELTFIRERVSLKQRLKIERTLKVNYVYLNESMRQAFTCLDNNEILMVAVDGKGEFHKAGARSVPVEFLGQKTYFSGGIGAFSRKKETPVLPASVFRREDGRYRLIIHPPLALDYKMTRREFTRDVVSKLANVFEKDIRQHPSQWEYWEEFTPEEASDGE